MPRTATKKIGGSKPATATATALPKEEPDVCCICYEEFDKLKKEMCMHEIETKERKIQHKIHQTCCKQWIKNCVDKGMIPFCPICPTVKIYYKKENLSLTQRIIASTHRYERVALTRFRDLRVDCPALFGIMVCINKRYIKCYMNYNMMVNADSCLRDIKHFIMSESDDIYASTGAHVPSKLSFNLNYQNWREWKYPQVRITDAHFAIPPYSEKIGLFGEALDDNTTLGELYIRYQTLAGEMYHMHELGTDFDNALSNIYMDKIIHTQYPTGPDDPGHDICAFVNYENPENLTAYNFKCATYNSVSWIAVHVEYE